MILEKKRVLMIVAPINFRDEEYFVPKEILEKNGATIVTGSTLPEAVSKQGIVVETDLMLGEIVDAQFDAIVFVGGAGSAIYFSMEKAHKIAQYYAQQQKLVCAICAAPAILAKADLLKGVQATCFVDQKRTLEKFGAIFTDAPVVIDNNIITANGPKASKAFGEQILKSLAS